MMSKKKIFCKLRTYDFIAFIDLSFNFQIGLTLRLICGASGFPLGSRQLQPVVGHVCYLINSDNIFSATSSNALSVNLHKYSARLVFQSIFLM
jgi:hypothetical protein